MIKMLVGVLMNKKDYLPYNFDSRYEYRTYKNIGRQIEIDYWEKKKLIYKLYNYCRKKNNKNESKYKNCRDYSEWEQYVVSKMPSEIIRTENLIHYLKSKRRSGDFVKNIFSSVMTPLFMTYISVIITILVALYENENEILINVYEHLPTLFIILLVYLLIYICIKWNNYYFYDDYISILETHKEEKKENVGAEN